MMRMILPRRFRFIPTFMGRACRSICANPLSPDGFRSASRHQKVIRRCGGVRAGTGPGGAISLPRCKTSVTARPLPVWAQGPALPSAMRQIVR